MKTTIVRTFVSYTVWWMQWRSKSILSLYRTECTYHPVIYRDTRAYLRGHPRGCLLQLFIILIRFCTRMRLPHYWPFVRGIAHELSVNCCFLVCCFLVEYCWTNGRVVGNWDIKTLTWRHCMNRHTSRVYPIKIQTVLLCTFYCRKIIMVGGFTQLFSHIRLDCLTADEAIAIEFHRRLVPHMCVNELGQH